MNIVNGRKVFGQTPKQIALHGAQKKAAGAPATSPQCYYVGDVKVTWNVGNIVYRYKAARNVRISDITLDAREVQSPSGAPVVIELWLNGKFKGTVPLEQGANVFEPFSLSKLDEVDMRIVVKGERDDRTQVLGLWVLFCVV